MDDDVNIVIAFFVLTMSSKRAIRRGTVSKRGGCHLFGEGEKREEERRGRTEVGGETARELGKLSGKSANIRSMFNVQNKQCMRRLKTEIWGGIEGGKKREGKEEEPDDSPSFSSQELNLSYQDLGDPFQQENFLRILRRLIRVEKLQLVDNSLTNLSSVRLPRYESHYPEYTTTPSPVQQSELPVQRSWIPISCHRGVAQYQLMKNLFPCASQQCKQKLNSKKQTDAKNKNKQYGTRTTITKLYLWCYVFSLSAHKSVKK